MTPSTTGRLRVREPLLTRPFVLLALAELAYFTADGVAIYALPVFVTGPLGSDAVGAGLAFGAFALSALVLRPFAGRLADSRRPAAAAARRRAASARSAWSARRTSRTLAAVVALRLLLGVAEAAFFVAAIAAVADLAPPSRIGEAMSYNSLGLYLGLALGPPLGEVLVRTVGVDAAWYAAGGLALIAALIGIVLPETRRRAEGTATEPARPGSFIDPPLPVAARLPRRDCRDRRLPGLRGAARPGRRPGGAQRPAARLRRRRRDLPGGFRAGTGPPAHDPARRGRPRHHGDRHGNTRAGAGTRGSTESAR